MLVITQSQGEESLQKPPSQLLDLSVSRSLGNLRISIFTLTEFCLMFI